MLGVISYYQWNPFVDQMILLNSLSSRLDQLPDKKVYQIIPAIVSGILLLVVVMIQILDPVGFTCHHLIASICCVCNGVK